MRWLWRDPLLHFVLLGAGLFLLYGRLNWDASESEPRAIVVDRDKLLTYVQNRSRTFDRASFDETLNSLPMEALQRLIDDYVREEALYREAKALQLDRNDYVTRLRLIQQLEFITRGFVEVGVELTDEEIQNYYQAHQAEFYVSPKVTFTHVFFSRERHGAAQAVARARETLGQLNHKRVRFDQAPAYGDRFPYYVNYVAHNPEEVASHFGADMQQELFALTPSDWRWRGPFESPYGFHLVMLVRNEAGYAPPLEELRARVEEEATRAAIDARFEKSLRLIVRTYNVKVKRDEFAALQGRRNVTSGGVQAAPRRNSPLAQ